MTAARILAAKAEYYDKEQAFIAEEDALEKQKQQAVEQIQRDQTEAERKLALKVAPLQERIRAIEATQGKLHAAFAEWAHGQKARIDVLGETNGDTGN